MKVRLKIDKPFKYLGREFMPSIIYKAESTLVDALNKKLPCPAIWVEGILWTNGFDIVIENETAPTK